MKVEGEQLRQVVELAGRHGVFLHHCNDSRYCLGTPGLPDLLLVGPAGVLFRELKSSLLGVTSAQTSWRWMLRAAGADSGIWVPSDFRNGTVEGQIRWIASRGPFGQPERK